LRVLNLLNCFHLESPSPKSESVDFNHLMVGKVGLPPLLSAEETVVVQRNDF